MDINVATFNMEFIDEASELRNCSNNNEYHSSAESLSVSDDSSINSQHDTSDFHGLKFYEKPNRKLKEWALQHNITHIALKDLLAILNEDPCRNLPKDPRTFLSTPSKLTV